MMYPASSSMRRWLAAAFIALYAACVFAPIASALEASHHAISEETHRHAVDIEKYPEQHNHMGSADADAHHQTWSFVAADFSGALPVDSRQTMLALVRQLAGLGPDILIPPPRA